MSFDWHYVLGNYFKNVQIDPKKFLIQAKLISKFKDN